MYINTSGAVRRYNRH